jgi:ParB family chromosome partitioning protein
MAKKSEPKSKEIIKSQGRATAKDFKPANFAKKDTDKTKSAVKEAAPAYGKTVVKRGLGKGLDALIPGESLGELPNSTDVSRETLKLNINLIDPNPKQPRKKFDDDSLQELAASIKEHGLIEPIVVQQFGDRYIIVAGERRWRACKIANVTNIPVAIVNFTDQQLFEAALIENIQRKDLNPIEEAEAYNVLIKEYHLKQDEVAEKMCKSRVAVTNKLRLLNLDAKVRQLVVEDMITDGHARALLAIKDPNLQYRIAMKVFDEGLTVRETEKLVKSELSPKRKQIKEVTANRLDQIQIKDLEEKLKRSLGTKVTINQKDGKKGNIVIDYYSPDELDRLYDLLRKV